MANEDTDLRLLVRQLRWEADGVLSVLLENADGAELPAWTPGAHIDLTLPGGLVRQYSLCGSLDDRRTWRLGVLREPDGRGGSAAVHDRLRAGMVLEACGPRNNFALGDAQRYVFIAGGIGITPILAMVREAERRGADWTLLYGGRCRESMAFVEELRGHEGKVTLHPEAEHGLLPLVDLLATPVPGALVYCCGPERLIGAVSDAMASWPPGSLHIERFRPVAPAAEMEDSDHEFEVEAAGSGVRVRVPVGTTVVRALESVGVYPATSCEEGICGTCETKVLDGVPDHRDSLLSPEEQQAGNSMMICVSRCRGPRLVLDI
ncbi:oxidoreductase [Geodermatophilus sp. TF02-6]|uniref:PDR/VanB family oxidoreductase n=1 Tax=Geodermatophilus sp. TF02-6 TaxID=2250575 RepID=UPI000DEA11B2|nr:PDR/VanB family oxidoreductase [Geodermatophilus sp. TF02-6]RBY76115.1 oxidoreductase [Geodermatophilus sp. TF02-6]